MPQALKDFYKDMAKTLLTGLGWSVLGLLIGLNETFDTSKVHADNFWAATIFFGLWTGYKLIYGTNRGLLIVRSVLLVLPIMGLSALLVPSWLGNTYSPLGWFSWFMTYGLWTAGLGCGAIIATTLNLTVAGVNHLKRWFSAET